jgi:hypothetical protein
MNVSSAVLFSTRSTAMLKFDTCYQLDTFCIIVIVVINIQDATMEYRGVVAYLIVIQIEAISSQFCSNPRLCWGGGGGGGGVPCSSCGLTGVQTNSLSSLRNLTTQVSNSCWDETFSLV